MSGFFCSLPFFFFATLRFMCFLEYDPIIIIKCLPKKVWLTQQIITVAWINNFGALELRNNCIIGRKANKVFLIKQQWKKLWEHTGIKQDNWMKKECWTHAKSSCLTFSDSSYKYNKKYNDDWCWSSDWNEVLKDHPKRIPLRLQIMGLESRHGKQKLDCKWCHTIQFRKQFNRGSWQTKVIYIDYCINQYRRLPNRTPPNWQFCSIFHSNNGVVFKQCLDWENTLIWSTCGIFKWHRNELVHYLRKVTIRFWIWFVWYDALR